MSYLIQHISGMDYVEVYDNGDGISTRLNADIEHATRFQSREDAEKVLQTVPGRCVVVNHP